MKVPFFSLERQNQQIGDELKTEICKVVDSLNYSSGKEVEKFEETFANYCGAKYCVLVNSGTAALHLSMIIARINTKHTLTTANTFVATCASILMENGQLQFIDINPNNGNIDTDLLLKETEKVFEYHFSTILVPVSMYGIPYEIDVLQEKLKIYNQNYCRATLIHDCCQSHGALIKGQKLAQFAHITCYSFYPTKNLGNLGDCGALVTDDLLVYEKAKSLRNHGRDSEDPNNHSYLGYNYRASEISAAILNVKLKYLEEWTNKRIALANRYMENLKELSTDSLLRPSPENRNVWHLFPVFLENRDLIRKELSKLGVQTGLHYSKPVAFHPPFQNYWGVNQIEKTKKLMSKEISLPMFPELMFEEVDYVSECLLRVTKTT